jgi:hypothetical protein
MAYAAGAAADASQPRRCIFKEGACCKHKDNSL